MCIIVNSGTAVVVSLHLRSPARAAIRCRAVWFGTWLGRGGRFTGGAGRDESLTQIISQRLVSTDGPGEARSVKVLNGGPGAASTAEGDPLLRLFVVQAARLHGPSGQASRLPRTRLRIRTSDDRRALSCTQDDLSSFSVSPPRHRMPLHDYHRRTLTSPGTRLDWNRDLRQPVAEIRKARQRRHDRQGPGVQHRLVPRAAAAVRRLHRHAAGAVARGGVPAIQRASSVPAAYAAATTARLL
jgi:hypothetical protein